MNSNLTIEEIRAIGRIGSRRWALGLGLSISVLVLAADGLFLAGSFGTGSRGSNPPEWLIIPVIIGFAFLGLLIGLVSYMGGILKDREKAGFVRVSLDSLKASSVISDHNAEWVFRDIAVNLLDKDSSTVVRSLVSAGWPVKRARFYTGLVESIISRCEYNINCEAEAADFRAMLKKKRWSDQAIEALVGPAIEMIKEHGGRRTAKGIAGSIIKNVVWMIIILILAPAMGWLLFSDSGLDLSTKYDFVEKLVWMVPAFIGLGLNVASIIRKLNRG